MKKIVTVLLIAVMMLCAASAETLDGGWTVADDNAVTEENRAVFDKAVETLTGVDYKPIAYLGSQVVAGTSHCFLCKATVVVPDAAPALALVYVYEDLEGNCEILNIADFSIADFSETGSIQVTIDD